MVKSVTEANPIPSRMLVIGPTTAMKNSARADRGSCSYVGHSTEEKQRDAAHAKALASGHERVRKLVQKDAAEEEERRD